MKAALFTFLAITLALSTPVAASDSVIYGIHIGVNQPPAGSALPVLSYADDDAARFHDFTASFAQRALLFTVLDTDSQRLHPHLAAMSSPPRRAALETALAQLVPALQADRRAGRSPVVFFTFSGHGVADTGQTHLALLDDTIDQAWIERHLLALPAQAIHLVVDACHAEGLVTSRGAIAGEMSATTREFDEEERVALLRTGILERYPHVGALLASSAGRQSHEWSAIRSGVFTHELLSALSGAADVNVDGRIAYSEAAAFIAAANRQVTDPRARPRVISLPPKHDLNAPLMALAWIERKGLLGGRAGGLGHFQIEDDRGVRLIDAHLEPHALLRLVVPTTTRLWLRSGDREAAFQARPGETTNLASLSFAPLRAKARGAAADALRRGLFAHPYGPGYYRGWVDRRDEPGVPFAPDPDAEIRASAEADSKLPSIVLLTGVGLSLAATAVFGGLAIDAHLDYEGTTLERPAKRAMDRLELYRGLAIGSGVLCAGLAITGWLLWPDAQLQLAPAASPVGAGLAFRYRF